MSGKLRKSRSFSPHFPNLIISLLDIHMFLVQDVTAGGASSTFDFNPPSINRRLKPAATGIPSH